MFKKKIKKIPLYVLISDDHPGIFLTFTNEKSEATEYAFNYLIYKNFSHFKSWCELRDINFEDPKSAEEYFSTVIDQEEKNKYKVLKIDYAINDMVSILRMFGGCIPLGCSFDRPAEIQYFNDNLKQKGVMEDVDK